MYSCVICVLFFFPSDWYAHHRRVQEAQQQRKMQNAAYGNQASGDYMNALSKKKQEMIKAQADEERRQRIEAERLRHGPPQQGNI